MLIFIVTFSHWDLDHSGGSLYVDILYHYCLRWVCTSAMPADLEMTDNLAVTVLESIVKRGGLCGC